MKTFDKASIIAITFGCFYLIYNLYMLISSNPIFVENDLPSLIISFTSSGVSIYVFVMLKKLLNNKFKSKIADRYLVWVIILLVGACLLSLYLLVSIIALFFQGIDFLSHPSMFQQSVFDVIFQVIVLMGISIFLGIVFILLGNKLRKVKEGNTNLFLSLGIIIMIYGVLYLLTTFTIIENDFIAALVECFVIILIGMVFRKYANLNILDSVDLISEVEQIKPIDIIEKVPSSETNSQIVTDSTNENDDDDEMDKEDPRRFMPK